MNNREELDIIQTSIVRLRADVTAAELAMDALMGVLMPEQRQQWLAALETQRTAPSTSDHAAAAMSRRIARLVAAGTESSGGG